MPVFNFNDNIAIHAPKNIDDRTGPFLNIEEALRFIPISRRVQGLTLAIHRGGTRNGIIDNYWFRNGIQDSDLVLIEEAIRPGFFFNNTGITYNADGTVRRILIDYSPQRFKDIRMQYTNNLVTMIEIQNTLNNYFVRKTFTWVNNQCTMVEMANITAFTIVI